MKEVIGRNEPPFMVKVALWPQLSRGTALAFSWLSVLLAGVSGIFGLQDPRFFWGVMVAFAAPWYLMAIQWMDRNRGWVR